MELANEKDLKAFLDSLPPAPPRPVIDLLLVFYVNIGKMDIDKAKPYLRRFERSLMTGYLQLPDSVEILFVPSREETHVQAIPIKGFLDGTIKETAENIEKYLRELQDSLNLMNLVKPNKES